MSTFVSSADNREAFLNLLFETGIGGLHGEPHWESFVRGEGDIPMEALRIDSLAIMELGIVIEETYGVSLAPSEIGRYQRLGALWDQIVANQTIG
jgi:hypothetical protein